MSSPHLSKGECWSNQCRYGHFSPTTRSPSESGEDSARLPRRDVTRKVPFDLSDMNNPILVIGNTFRNASDFRKAVRQYNILRGKDLRFKKNELKRIVVVCKDSNCKYRVYGRQLKNEQTFLLVSIKPKHTCTRRYQNHMVTSTWIAEWCMDSFMEQPNMPIDVLRKKVKNKWNVDVHVSSLYRARKKARESIYGKLDEQYHRLWDYCSVVRSTNVGSCLILMVERPMPEVPCRFQRLYVSLAAMKNGFREGCRPVVGVDACFLKGHYKGQLMAAVGRDFLSPYYTKETWLKSYDHIVYLVPSVEQWPRSNQPKIEPPKSRVTTGRPKKIRQRGVEEPRNPNSVKRGGNKVQCGHCKKFGHNQRSCEARQRHEERRARVRQFYRENATTEWNLDMVLVYLCKICYMLTV
jgi:hypothetical protein